MNDSLKYRVGSLRLVLGLAGLALSIVLWGLAYKLSLYAPAQNSFHSIPHAKLLSENERSLPTLAHLHQTLPDSLGIQPWTVLTGGMLFGGFLLALWGKRDRHCALSFYGGHRRSPKAPRLSSMQLRPPPFLC